MAGDEIDIELFIGEIQKYPEIWNIANEDYHDRNKKRAAWVKICREFSEGFEEKSDNEKNKICNMFIKKWRNIKDSYSKSLKKKTSGQAADSGRQYIYARQLSFLQNSNVSIESQSTIDGTEDQDVETLVDEAGQTIKPGRSDSQTYEQRASRKKKHEIEAALLKFMTTPISSSTTPAPVPEANADRSFFESILPSISDFNEDKKLEFRCEVLNLIKRMRASDTIPHHIPSNVSYHTYPTSQPSTYVSLSSPQLTPDQSYQFSPQSAPTLHKPTHLHKPQYHKYSAFHFPLSRQAPYSTNETYPQYTEVQTVLSSSSPGNNAAVSKHPTSPSDTSSTPSQDHHLQYDAEDDSVDLF